jgi:hypothetical protein
VPSFYKAFPTNIHLIESYSSPLSTRKLQEKIIRVFYEINGKEFSFEDVSNPTVPEGTVIFNIGLAGAKKFNLINSEQVNAAIGVLTKENLQTIDFIIVIRYYKGKPEKRVPLRFDYYLMRTIYGKDKLEMQIAHDCGPRYVTPEDLSEFIVSKINVDSKKKPLKKLNT